MSKYSDIKKAASHAIERTMLFGEKRYPGEPWRTRSDLEDLQHASSHLTAYAHTGDLDDLDSAITRLSLISGRRQT